VKISKKLAEDTNAIETVLLGEDSPMANPAKYDPSASIVSPPDPEFDPEFVTESYTTPFSAPVYTTAPPSDPIPVPVSVPVTVPDPCDDDVEGMGLVVSREDF